MDVTYYCQTIGILQYPFLKFIDIWHSKLLDPIYKSIVTITLVGYLTATEVLEETIHYRFLMHHKTQFFLRGYSNADLAGDTEETPFRHLSYF